LQVDQELQLDQPPEMAENGKIIAVNKMVKIVVVYCHNIPGYRTCRNWRKWFKTKADPELLGL